MPGASGPAGMPEAIAVGRYEVTRDEFGAFEQEDLGPSPRCFFMFDTSSIEDFDGWTRQTPGLGGYRPSGRDPAICVSWIEAQLYVEWLSQKTGQLPTDREWQFFESGNAMSRYAWGDRNTDAYHYANGLDRRAASEDWATNPLPDFIDVLLIKNGVLDCDDGAAYTAPVGSYKPNVFGLYDTIGNIWSGPATASPTRTNGRRCVLSCTARGGSWQSSPDELTSQAQQKVPLG